MSFSDVLDNLIAPVSHTNTPLLTEEQYAQIEETRRRGVPIKMIFHSLREAKMMPYSSVGSLRHALRVYRKRRGAQSSERPGATIEAFGMEYNCDEDGDVCCLALRPCRRHRKPSNETNH